MREPEGFREYVLARQGALLRTARLLTGDHQLAEDLAQTALARAWPHWDRITRGGDPDAYVRRVLVTTYASWWRRRWHGEHPTAALPDTETAPDPYSPIELRDAVACLLNTLTRRQRAVIVLRYFDDLSEAATADLLGCSIGTVKTTTSRALAKLRASTPTLGLDPQEHR
ncbi:SigE family RNA polymerase sigma factor [Motilibacter deserti]|uniref:SigE family RNA polymerase sigma factor n=1 Tax=Motilibacter deserti TaxID=2714956 RepID=UPI002F2B57DB